MGPLAIGTVFAGHRIEALVGRGGMGVVYRARHLELDRVVALKVIAPELLEDTRVRERFVREARTAASIEHPNVIPVHYAGDEDGIAYLAMRFVDGDDIRQLVRLQGVLAPERAARIVRQAATALDAIHAAGFVHRDIKPANLLVAQGDHVYLTDFGLAKQAITRSGATHSGHWVGTLDYVAPEQIRGGRIDARADIYALGGVLHFMLTAHVPFDRDTDEAKLWAHLADPPPLPSRLRPELPAAMDAVVGRAMAKDPDLRQPSAGDLARAALAAAGGGAAAQPERMVARGAASPEGAAKQPGLAEEVPTLTGVGRSADGPAERRRARRALPAVAVLALLIVAAVVVIATTRGGGQPSSTGHPRARTSGAPSPGFPRVGLTIRRVGRRPNGIAAAGRDLWVSSAGRPVLSRIDAATGRQRAQHPRVGRGALDIVAGPTAVWVAVTPARVVLRVDPRSGRVVRRVRTPLRPVALAAGGDDIWVVGRAAVAGRSDALLHYDGRGRLLRSIAVRHGMAALVVGAGALWAVELRHPRVVRFDMRTGRKRGLAALDGRGFALAYGDGYLWVSLSEEDSVARVDPRSGAVVTSAVGHHPAGLAVARGRLFVASTTDHAVIVIDPRTARPIGRPLSVGLNPYAVAAGFGHVWVTDVGANTVARLDGE